MAPCRGNVDVLRDYTDLLPILELTPVSVALFSLTCCRSCGCLRAAACVRLVLEPDVSRGSSQPPAARSVPHSLFCSTLANRNHIYASKAPAIRPSGSLLKGLPQTSSKSVLNMHVQASRGCTGGQDAAGVALMQGP